MTISQRNLLTETLKHLPKITENDDVSLSTKVVWLLAVCTARSRNPDPCLRYCTAPLLPRHGRGFGGPSRNPPTHLPRTTRSSSPPAFTKTPPDGFLALRERGEQDGVPAHGIHSSLRKTNGKPS